MPILVPKGRRIFVCVRACVVVVEKIKRKELRQAEHIKQKQYEIACSYHCKGIILFRF